MKQTNFSTRKKLMASASMLMVSVMMLGSATYAWFTMNKEVSVTNMQVQAKADQGLLINEVADHTDEHWDNIATTNQNAGILLHATSTANTKTWYVAYSKLSDSAAEAASGTASTDLTSDGYRTLGTAPFSTSVQSVAEVAGTNALQEITYVDKDGDTAYDNGEGYYVKYTYYLKSSGDAISCALTSGAQSLNIRNVTATSTTTTSADLDKALRVAIVVNGKAYIFAPLYNAAQTYYVNAAATGTTTLTGTQPTAMTSIPDVTTDGVPVYVYLYFEGEDTNLKTSNATDVLDNMVVSFDFALIDNASDATDNGIAVPTT